MTPKKTLVAQVPNLNGDTKDSLLEALQHALAQLGCAQRALRATCPHGRNFQTMPDTSAKLSVALFQHAERQIHIEKVVQELEGLYEAVEKGQTTIEV